MRQDSGQITFFTFLIILIVYSLQKKIKSKPIEWYRFFFVLKILLILFCLFILFLLIILEAGDFTIEKMNKPVLEWLETGFFIQENNKYVSILIDYVNKKVIDKIKENNKEINININIGSHNSMTYLLNTDKYLNFPNNKSIEWCINLPLVKKYFIGLSECQNKNLSQQVEDGVRFFNLPISKKGNDFIIDHGVEICTIDTLIEELEKIKENLHLHLYFKKSYWDNIKINSTSQANKYVEDFNKYIKEKFEKYDFTLNSDKFEKNNLILIPIIECVGKLKMPCRFKPESTIDNWTKEDYYCVDFLTEWANTNKIDKLKEHFSIEQQKLLEFMTKRNDPYLFSVCHINMFSLVLTPQKKHLLGYLIGLPISLSFILIFIIVFLYKNKKKIGLLRKNKIKYTML
jgi:hypothetical protein